MHNALLFVLFWAPKKGKQDLCMGIFFISGSALKRTLPIDTVGVVTRLICSVFFLATLAPFLGGFSSRFVVVVLFVVVFFFFGLVFTVVVLAFVALIVFSSTQHAAGRHCMRQKVWPS
jgi:hypothetical protein